MLNDKIKIKLSGIIVNADDYGLSLSRNEAVIHAFTQKMCSRGSIVVNTPYFEDAVKLAKENDLMGKFGLHINLTSGVPLTLPICKVSKYCSNNKFIGTNPRSLTKVFSVRYVKEIREEIEAQILRFFQSGFTLRHIDAHNDILFNLPVWLAIKPLLKKYKIESIRGVEPYLFGFYRKSIISYLPIKYYFMCHFLFNKGRHYEIQHGGRNINQFINDFSNNSDRRVGSLRYQKRVEVIIHPDKKDDLYVDLTNFDKTKTVYSLEDTKNKLKRIR